MSQCVPSWDLHPDHTTDSKASDADPVFGFEVAELTWENGQLAMHSLAHQRVLASKHAWEKPLGSGTLESIVNQATHLAPCNENDELVPMFDHQQPVTTSTATITMDALVPCSKHVPKLSPTSEPENLTRVGSCAGPRPARKRARVANVNVGCDGNSRNYSVGASVTLGKESRFVPLDTSEMDFGVGFTSTSLGSPEETSLSTGKREVGTDEDKKSHNEKSTVSTKRSRAAAVHNQSERKRRDKINQRMKTLQKLVPNSSKTDKASMLDEVIEYLKQLQAQVSMMSRMNMPQMMMPMALQQQMQMSMMAQMGMNMGMGMGLMDINLMGRTNISRIPPILNPASFMPLTSWDGTGNRVHSSATVLPDPMSAFLACQAQPMTMDSYTRMAALYQQLHQQSVPISKS
ncbi:hypothetical protein GIB67_036504 [Kingdonia uniflora]|uniref:BHLH domain-containing protein n=1 Tax=Kingdonia uniflora TaxID=39325 RepID=A0A7J7P7W9_9MAGN|nr:hypothetical protein GIB67_036504 [Kingdonia uniflora]